MKALVSCLLLAACGGATSSSTPAAPPAFPSAYPGMRTVAATVAAGGTACDKLAAVLAAGSHEEKQLAAAATERAALAPDALAAWQASHAAELDGWATGIITVFRDQTCGAADGRWPILKAAFVAMAEPAEPPPVIAKWTAVVDEMLAKADAATDCEAFEKEMVAQAQALDAELKRLPARLQLVDDFVWEEAIEARVGARAATLTGPCTAPFKQ